MAEPPTDDQDAPPLPRNLRYLKLLVTVLTAVMILGVITIVALLVIRLNADPRPILVMPESYALPPGVEITGYSQTGDHVVIVGDDGVIRVFHATTRDLVQEIDLRD